MQFAATQMDLEIFKSSEGSQTEREKYCMAFSGYRIQNETIWEYDIETPTKILNLSTFKNDCKIDNQQRPTV